MFAYTKEQKALQAHIEAENARNADSFFSVCADPAHWLSYDIYNIEQYEHYMAVEDYIDCFKSVHGIKPRWMDFSEMTVAQIRVEADALAEEWQGQAEWQAEWDAHMEVIDAEKERVAHLFADPTPNKFEVLALRAGWEA